MVFTKRLREGIRRGEITCTVRFWFSPHVTVGKRSPMEAGFGVCTYKPRGEKGAIEVDSTEPIGLPDITPELARESGFLGVLDLLKVAKYGRGENIYLIRFHYIRPRSKKNGKAKTSLGFAAKKLQVKMVISTSNATERVGSQSAASAQDLVLQ